MNTLAFYIFATITVTATVAMITRRNPVASAVFLVVSFMSLAGIYVLLGAPFVAALQILIYAGTIMVLFIFVIMLLNLKEDELIPDRIDGGRVFTVILGLALFAFLGSRLAKIPGTAVFLSLPADFGGVKQVASLMLTEYVVPFEILGVLLLVGLVGAVLLGRREE